MDPTQQSMYSHSIYFLAYIPNCLSMYLRSYLLTYLFTFLSLCAICVHIRWSSCRKKWALYFYFTANIFMKKKQIRFLLSIAFPAPWPFLVVLSENLGWFKESIHIILWSSIILPILPTSQSTSIILPIQTTSQSTSILSTPFYSIVNLQDCLSMYLLSRYNLSVYLLLYIDLLTFLTLYQL